MRHTVALAILSVLIAVPFAKADAFDQYINPILAKVPQAKGVQEIKQLTPDLIADHDQVLSDVTAAFIVVQTNENRWSKLLVQAARRKLDNDRSVPILLIDRFVTFKEGEDQKIHANGKNVNLFNGFRFNLDFGQVVPGEFAADLRFVVEGDKVFLEPLGKAKIYLLTQPLPEANPKKSGKLVVGATFEMRYFAGSYKLYDDGRRSGILKLQVDDEGGVSGGLVSDKDGSTYEVVGKVLKEKHNIQFMVKLPRTEQYFVGWMFTGDGKAITGTSELQSRKTGFYAVRIEE